MIETDERHPELLPWFADGRLSPGETEEIEQHLSRCPSCRDEVDALQSLYRSLRMRAEPEHVSPERLVDHHVPGRSTREEERRAVEQHLADCDLCASDLRALRRADATSVRRRTRWVGAAAALLFVTVGAGWLTLWREGEAIPHVATRVEFPSAQRGVGEITRLTGDGPWEFLVWAPLGGTAYTVRMHHGDDPEHPALEAPAEASPKDGSVLIVVPKGVLRPGLHTLSLIPRDGDGSPNYVRRFEVVGSP